MSDFQTVKNAYPLVRYVKRKFGSAKTKESGDNIYINPAPCCDHNDCFHITPSKEVWNCFSCESGGDIFDLAMKVDGLTKSEALRSLADDVGVEIRDPGSGDGLTRPSGMTKKQEVWAAAIEIFHEQLLEDEKMMRYQTARRGHEIQTLRRFKIGWAKNGLYQALCDRGFKGDAIKGAGLLRPRENSSEPRRDYFYNSFIYPSFDAAGRPLQLRCKFPKEALRQAQGDKGEFAIKNPDRKGYPLTNEFRSKDWICYNQGVLSKHDELVVCEGEDDLLTWHESGIPNVVGTCGGPTNDQLNFFTKYHSGKTWLLAYDQDDAGRGFVERFAKRGLKIKVIEMGE